MRAFRQVTKPAFLTFAGASLLALPAHAQALVDLLARPGDHMASTLVAAGDFDGDGVPDVLVGVDQSLGKQRPTYVQGGVALLSGRNGGLLFSVTGDDYEALTGRAPLADFGRDCGMVGDFDQDGTCDVLVVHGNPKIVRNVVAFSGRTRAILFEIVDPYRRTNFGDRIQRLGDLLDAQGNLVPDGVPDFAVTAPLNPISVPPPSYPGLVRIYSGAAPGNGPAVTLVGNLGLAAFGTSIAQIGDLDGDGKPGLAVGAPAAGYVELFDGPGFVSFAVLNSPLPRSAGFGSALANLGDLDGDGTTELAIGCPGTQHGIGRVLVYSLDPRGARLFTRLDPENATEGSSFGAAVAPLPVDPMSGRGLLDLDHDGVPDPFFDWNRDGVPDFLIGAPGYDNFAGGDTAAGAVFLVPGTGAALQLAREPIHQGEGDTFLYPYLPTRTPRRDEAFGQRIAILGSQRGESQARFAFGTPRDEQYRGSLALVRPPMLHFDDDTFSLQNDGLGTSRRLELDFGPLRAGRRYLVLASSAGASPGQHLQGLRVPLNDDGPGGLWPFTLAGVAGGTPLGFSQLSGVLDAAGRATVTLTVTGPTAGHPWFNTIRQHYTAILTRPGQPGTYAQVSATTQLFIQ